MARKGTRSKFSRYVKGNIAIDLAPGTLNPLDVSTVNTQSVDTNMRVSSVTCTYTMQGGDTSAGAGQGPLRVGWAHGDYSADEIEGFLEEGTSWAEGDLVAREIRGRLIRVVGVFGIDDSSGGGAKSLNDGKPITTKLNWFIEDAETIQFFVYNAGSGALVTGIEIYAEGYANLWGV